MASVPELIVEIIKDANPDVDLVVPPEILDLDTGDAWELTLGDKSLKLEDLSPDEMFTVAQDHPGTTWRRLYDFPAADPGAFYDLVSLCSGKLGVSSPGRPANKREGDDLLGLLRRVRSDVPTVFEDGAPLSSSAEGKETT